MGKNRSIEQKILKMKRRNRHAVFSGPTSKFATRPGPNPFSEDAQGKTTSLPQKRILVGPVSLSKAVINTGRGPDNSRMQEYYQRLHSYDQSLPETLGLTEPMKELKANYDRICNDMKNMRVRLLEDNLASLDLFFVSGGNQWFFVEVNKQKHFIRRSTIYPSKKYALLFLDLDKVTWVERIPK